MTELKIDRFVLLLLSIVPIKEALLKPEREFIKEALFLVSILRISWQVKLIVDIKNWFDIESITNQLGFCFCGFFYIQCKK
jgi:hypothetical protein